MLKLNNNDENENTNITNTKEKLLPGYKVDILTDTDVKGQKAIKPYNGFTIVQKLQNGNYAIPSADGKMLEFEGKNLKRSK